MSEMVLWTAGLFAAGLLLGIALRVHVDRKDVRRGRLRAERERKRRARMQHWAASHPEDADLQLADDIAREIQAERWSGSLPPLTHTRGRR